MKVEELIKSENFIIIDTRTPAEFKEAHIPKAINIPLFTNEERAIVGTLYKQEGKNIAIKEGINIFSKKMPTMMEDYFKFKNKKLLIYCWRGGMRSKVIVNFLDALGFYVKQLEGGHKAYRNYVLNYFKSINFKPKLTVLYGLTGAGKTELLHELEDTIDLEDIAQHRSSLLGKIGLKPRSQKMFDAILFDKLKELENKKNIFIEGESRKIGKVEMPEFLWQKMKKSKKIKITCPLKDRAKRIIKEYFSNITKKDLDYIIEILPKLKQKLSNKVIEELRSNINNKEYEQFTITMLEKYYDPLYEHTINEIKYDLETPFNKALIVLKENNSK